MDNVSREQRIIRTSIIGIIANVLLAGFKAAVGLISHSVAITLDAVSAPGSPRRPRIKSTRSDTAASSI